jgi:nitrite reductase (NADH) small subunit
MAKEHILGAPEDFPENTHHIVRVGNREVGVFNINGAWHAIPNLCPHQRGPLCTGSVSGTLDYGPHTGNRLAWLYDGEIVTCPWHSLEFHVPTGRCLALPNVRLRKFPVHVAGDELVIVT